MAFCYRAKNRNQIANFLPKTHSDFGFREFHAHPIGITKFQHDFTSFFTNWISIWARLVPKKNSPYKTLQTASSKFLLFQIM
jgi:hypothetical protein